MLVWYENWGYNTGATLGISIHGCTFHQESDFVSSLTGSLAKDLEIHGFTGTQGTRPNAAPDMYQEFNNDPLKQTWKWH